MVQISIQNDRNWKKIMMLELNTKTLQRRVGMEG